MADDVIVYPAHGAGSACGKNMSKETTDQLGNQKKNNYALRADMTKEEFVKEVTAGLLPPSGYFPMNVKMNREGYASIETVLQQGQQTLPPDAFEAAANETNALVLDTRKPEKFCEGFHYERHKYWYRRQLCPVGRRVNTGHTAANIIYCRSGP